MYVCGLMQTCSFEIIQERLKDAEFHGEPWVWSSLRQTYNLFICYFFAPTFAVQALERTSIEKL